MGLNSLTTLKDFKCDLEQKLEENKLFNNITVMWWRKNRYTLYRLVAPFDGNVKDFTVPYF